MEQSKKMEFHWKIHELEMTMWQTVGLAQSKPGDFGIEMGMI